ncbi:MAG: (2Fe-2S)-binding protein [Spirochaetes bacterium]|nr:(2Fe-2S)-binding protein [Spirochaetota bacterium]
MKKTFTVNGEEHTFIFEPHETLLSVLRKNGFTEVKSGCGEGECGACLLLLDGRLVNSCQVFAATAAGKKITTVKGIGTIHDPHPVQEAFCDTGAVQCGFCTPGMVLAAFYLLGRNPDPSEEEIKTALDGNLCRCTGYTKIIEAVRLASKRMSGDG